MDVWIGGMIGGAVGAVIGHAANHFIGWFKENKQSSPERKFICAELIFILEDYSARCAEVVQDDGEPSGDQGEINPAVKLPEPIDYTLVKGNWRALKSDTMYEICSLPILQQEARKKISFISEHSSPPFYSDYFEERKLQFSTLGLKAVNIAKEIRNDNNFPAGELNPWVSDIMEQTLQGILSRRERDDGEGG